MKAGEKYGVDPFVLAAQAKQESSWGQNMANGDGVMQVEAATRGDNAARRQVMNTTTPANPIRLKWPP
ncbi:hypothetical protein EAW52_25630 [Pseudomonas sp. LTJR-52]|uniref:transglycosylase SLT domain-containing protein n=1 Tax=Pseudomonas sp. LTJR-52 TaxID=2479392 RepID=UPI000EFB0C5A|nr:transglycosylase SLT domain-containing protein [Pseudomonas sp. LTJR-52]AYN97061.1 hypothetical protein EAW52_25630 [Pseudomonas sp. LTJR-52]